MTQVKDRDDRLDYVLVEVNGKARLVKAGEELAVVRGDKLAVKEAVLIGRGRVREVNVLGYQRPGTSGLDDRGSTFSTAELAARWSEQEGGEVYAVIANARKATHGLIYVRLVEPVLKWAEVSINGKRRVLRDGEPLRASAKDLVKVERVETNLGSVDDVVFQIVPAVPTAGATADTGRYEIRFLRGERPFARIPLTLVTLEGG